MDNSVGMDCGSKGCSRMEEGKGGKIGTTVTEQKRIYKLKSRETKIK